jgi:hypothetical protein
MLAGGEGWPDSGEQAARVGFGLTLSRLAGLTWRKTTPAMVGGEGAAEGRGDRNAGELAGRLTNVRARERSRGARGG